MCKKLPVFKKETSYLLDLFKEIENTYKLNLETIMGIFESMFNNKYRVHRFKHPELSYNIVLSKKVSSSRGWHTIKHIDPDTNKKTYYKIIYEMKLTKHNDWLFAELPPFDVKSAYLAQYFKWQERHQVLKVEGKPTKILGPEPVLKRNWKSLTEVLYDIIYEYITETGINLEELEYRIQKMVFQLL